MSVISATSDSTTANAGSVITSSDGECVSGLDDAAITGGSVDILGLLEANSEGIGDFLDLTSVTSLQLLREHYIIELTRATIIRDEGNCIVEVRGELRNVATEL